MKMGSFEIRPVAWVKNEREEPRDDFWGGLVSEIILDDRFPDSAFDGIEHFSHLEIIFYFDRGDPDKIIRDSRHPRGNQSWPKVGIFAQRNKNRPNFLGLTTVELTERTGRILRVKGLDAINETPVIDIKPIVEEYLPKGKIAQPVWVSELMKDYWKETEK